MVPNGTNRSISVPTHPFQSIRLKRNDTVRLIFSKDSLYILLNYRWEVQIFLVRQRRHLFKHEQSVLHEDQRRFSPMPQ